jgi:HEAT repeat protein
MFHPRDVRKLEADEIGDDKVIALFTKQLEDRGLSARTRERAATELRRIGGERVIRPLITALRDTNPWSEARKIAIETLQDIGWPAVEPLREALEDESPEWDISIPPPEGFKPSTPRLTVKRTIMLILGGLKDRGSVERLTQALKYGDADIRECAARVLGLIGEKEAVEPLVELLQDEGRAVRKRVVWSLGRIGDKRAMESLIRVLREDEDSDVRRDARTALEQNHWIEKQQQ